MEKYDLVVIGSGPGGYVAAIRASQLGLRTAVVEKETPGGVCLNWGCIPSKAIITAAELYEDVKRSEHFGIKVTGLSVDYAQVIARSRDIAARLAKGVEYLLRKNNIALLRGTACLGKDDKVQIEMSQGGLENVQGDRILLATGSRERTLPGLEIDGERVVTSYEALTDTEIPESIVIVGGGAIGVEFAYVYNTFGSRVTVVEMEGQLLPGVDKEVSQELERSFKSKGIEILTNAKFQSLKKFPGRVELVLESESGTQQRIANKVFVAVGRTPVTDEIGLEEAGVVLERGYIKVDEKMQTSRESVYAIGDVTGPPLLAHAATDEGIAAVEFMTGNREKPLDATRIPACIYCQPQVAVFGATEEQARMSGTEVKVGRYPFKALGKALASGHEEGMVKLVVDKDYGEVLGCHIIGKGATDLIAEIGLARTLEATTSELMETVHAHPTLSEAIMEAALDAEGRGINQ